MRDTEYIVKDSRHKQDEYIPRFTREVGRLLFALAEYNLAKLRIADGREFSMHDYEGKLQTACVAVLFTFKLMVESIGMTVAVEDGAKRKIDKVVNRIKERKLVEGE